MLKGKKIIALFTAVLLFFLIFIIVYNTDKSETIPFYVIVSSDGATEKIDCFKSGDNKYYVFLPSYADISDVKIYTNTENIISIDGIDLQDGMSCEDFELDVEYSLTYNSFGKNYKRSITFMRSGEIATMYINTESGNMDYIHEQKGNEESGNISVYTSDGEVDYVGEIEAINGRGNNTWEEFDKKPYSIKLKNEADLLGMGKAQKWILLANAADSSNLRNKIVYDFAKEVGLKYSPDCEWVDLYLNGEYAGLYLLCERNEVGEERVDISKENSFIVSLERHDRITKQNYTYISTNSNQYLRVHYPFDASTEVLTELSLTWQSVENAIIAEDGIDPITGKSWQELIDLDSWVRKYLIEEVFGSGDACYISQFFYCDGTDDKRKIYAGPAWDFDHSMGDKAAWQLISPNTLYANRLNVKDGFNTPWFYSLYKKQVFYDRMTQLYQTECLPLLEQFLSKDLYSYEKEISQSYELNKIRWGIEENLQEETEYINGFMAERIEFLNSVWIEQDAFCTVKADQGFGGFYAYYYITPGETLDELPEFDDTEYSDFTGWYYADTDEPFDASKPIYEDTAIYAKWRNSASNKLDNILKLAPLGVIAVMFLVLLVIEIKRIRKGG